MNIKTAVIAVVIGFYGPHVVPEDSVVLQVVPSSNRANRYRNHRSYGSYRVTGSELEQRGPAVSDQLATDWGNGNREAQESTVLKEVGKDCLCVQQDDHILLQIIQFGPNDTVVAVYRKVVIMPVAVPVPRCHHLIYGLLQLNNNAQAYRKRPCRSAAFIQQQRAQHIRSYYVSSAIRTCSNRMRARAARENAVSLIPSSRNPVLTLTPAVRGRWG